MDMRLPNSFSIFPVSGKKPLVQWGEYSKRLPNEKEKKNWESKGSNYGIATGSISKILVLDDDGGLDIAKYRVPKTLSQKTPKGGRHYFFKWTEDLNSKITTKVGVLDKVDTRGEGGYVCFYGFEKPYFTVPIALPPKWLIDLLPNKHDTSKMLGNRSNCKGPDCEESHNCVSDTHEKSKIQELLERMSHDSGNRNDSFFRIASSLRDRGYSFEDILGILTPKAREVEFPLKELGITIRSATKYQPTRQEISTEQASSIEEFLKDQEKVEWIVPGIIAKRSIGFVAGLPETGKTWMMIDLAIQCAKGGLWLNKFPVEKQKVLYIDQERFKGETQRRFKAIINGSTLQQPFGDALSVKSGTTVRINLQHSFDAFRKELSELRPSLVIIDSFVTFHTNEENNRKDIQEVLERVKELRNEFGCTFLFIHHENKMAFDKESGDPSISQMAGSIAIPAVAETVLTVRKQDAESSMVYMTKSTLATRIEPFLIKIEDANEEKTAISVLAY